MSIVMPNCTIDTARAVYTVGQGTSVEYGYLQGIEARIQPVQSRHVRMDPTSAINLLYELRVPYETDVRLSDIIQNITLLDTGQQMGAMIDGTQTWRVIDAYDGTPGVLGYRVVTIERVIAGGPVPL
jgi:hypothetical protein